MPNLRTFLVQGLKLNAVDVAGLASLSLSGDFTVVQGRPDGGLGIEEVSRGGLSCSFSAQCADVSSVNAILGAAKADTIFYGKESGAATYRKYTIPSSVAWIVLNSMNLSLSSRDHGSLSLNGKISFLDGTKTLVDALTSVAAQAAPTLVHPIRLSKPNSVSFDPIAAGEGTNVTPKHTSAVSLSLSGETIEDYSDTDLSTVVDFVRWNALEVSWTFRDASVTSGSNIVAALLGKSYGTLTVLVDALGGQAGKTLTVNNVLWKGYEQRDAKDYSEFTIKGVAGWRLADATAYLMNASPKLFVFA